MIKYKIGGVVAIPLGDGKFGYGRVLKAPEMAFYNCLSSQILPLTEVISRSILFRIFVLDEAIKDGSWDIIGRAPLSNDLLIRQPYFVWGPFQEQSFITYDGSENILATPEQCKGLERVIIWHPEMVSVRLYDSLMGNHDNWIQRVEQD